MAPGSRQEEQHQRESNDRQDRKPRSQLRDPAGHTQDYSTSPLGRAQISQAGRIRFKHQMCILTFSSPSLGKSHGGGLMHHTVTLSLVSQATAYLPESLACSAPPPAKKDTFAAGRGEKLAP